MLVGFIGHHIYIIHITLLNVGTVHTKHHHQGYLPYLQLAVPSYRFHYWNPTVTATLLKLRQPHLASLLKPEDLLTS